MPARPRDRYRLFEAKPSAGGVLITYGSSDNAGTFNYTVKRDFRRDLDVEQRREGADYFYPKLDIPIGGQPYPGQILLDSLTASGGVATGTHLQGHFLEVGETIIITGANDPLYNGTFTITSVSSTTFTFTVPGTPVSPDTSTAITATPVEEINLIAMARRPNSQIAVIAGSQRRLYRFYALEDEDYISHDPADYPPGTPVDQLSYWSDGYRYPGDAVDYPPGTIVRQQQYVDEIDQGFWIVIGHGYSHLGKRWETVNINGYMVFNNAVDLPCTYRVEELSVVPIWELREQGIASVGTISEINGILVCADITEIQADQIPDWFNTAGRIQVTSVTNANVAGIQIATATILAGQPFQTGDQVTISGCVGDELNGTFRITATTPTTFSYVINGTPTSPDASSFIYARAYPNYAPYGIFTETQYLTRTQFRVLWGIPGEPRRFGAIVNGAMHAGSNSLRLRFPALSFTVGMNVTVVGAGASHAGGTADNLTGNVLFVNGDTLILDSFAQTTIIGTPVEASDALGSIVGYEDLQDDGSAILKMMPLSNTLVIYKDTSIFLAQYLGIVDQPFAFTPIRIQKEESIFYRNTLALVITKNEMYHVYAGRNSFYKFDLTNQQPMIIPKFEACSNLFFDYATLANTEKIFAMENGITHEILFSIGLADEVGGSAGPTTSDLLILWDYKQDTISTSSLPITAGATIRKPITGIASGAEEDWCVFGTARGVVLIYGKTNIAQATPDWNNGSSIYFRRMANPYSDVKGAYQSVMKSGMGAYGNDVSEKDIRFLLLLLASQSPGSVVTMNIYGAQNTDGTITPLGTKIFTNVTVRNLMPMALRRFYFQSEVVVDGVDNPLRYVGIAHSVAPVDSRSAPRG